LKQNNNLTKLRYMVKSLNMKLWTKPICLTCILEVTMKTIQLATSDETYNLKQSKNTINLKQKIFRERYASMDIQ